MMSRLLSPTETSPETALPAFDRPRPTTLSFQPIAPWLRRHPYGSLCARNPLLLLDHPSVDVAALGRVGPVRFEGLVEDVHDETTYAYRRSGLPARTRQAVTHEVASLARLLASLAINRSVSLEIGVSTGEAIARELAGRQGELVAIAQPLAPAAPDPDGARYRRALIDRDRVAHRDGRQALVAWGSGAHVARAIATGLTGGRDDQPVVWLAAARAATSPLGSAGESTASVVDDVVRDAGPVILVSAPFAPIELPSLGLSLLRATVTDRRLPILYLGIPFAETIGASWYDAIANGKPSFQVLLGEWVFARALGSTRAEADYLQQVLCEETLAWFRHHDERDYPIRLLDFQTLEELRASVAAAQRSVETWTEQILRGAPRIVAFTSLFQQHAASLALARRIKKARPGVTTLFGGSNCEGEMGQALLESYDFVDVVVSGEADTVFAEVITRVLERRGLEGLGGVYTVQNRIAPGLPVPNAPRPDVNELPRPDFDDFFAQWNRSSLRATVSPRLLLETSRGCWWGEKHHCTFCGLNGESMMFRSKRPERALADLQAMVARYPGHDVAAVDQILDMKYFSTVVEALATDATDTAFFYEIKANLTRRQVELLKRAGIVHVQPGIESLNDRVLRSMAKGVTALQNIQLIKWCTELGIVPYWNILWGFPGETADDYREMSEIVPLLTHLMPPRGSGPLRLDRFSPYYFAPDRFGLTRVTAAQAYSFIHDVGLTTLDRLAYFFDFDYAAGRPDDLADATLTLWQQLEAWRAAYAASRLVHLPVDDRLLVFDSRPAAVDSVHLLDGDERRVFEAADGVQSLPALETIVGDARRARDAVSRLRERRLVVELGGRVVSLSLCGTTMDLERTVAVVD